MTEKISLEALYRELIEHVGEAPAREGLRKTPKRAAEALRYLTQGYQQTLAEVVNEAVFIGDYDEIVLVKDLEFYSLCEHHLLPFFGQCHLAYLPDGKILGLSKLARIVDMFARRLQVQERLTRQIAEAMVEAVAPRGVAVVCEARHCCMMMRGVEKQRSSVITSASLGDPSVRRELMSLIKLPQ